MKVIYVGGVKGVGKTFVLRKVFKQLFLERVPFQRAKVAAVMFDLLKRNGVVEKYDELENISVKIKDRIRKVSFKKILEDKNENLIFDGHYSISSHFGYEYGVPLSFIKEINYFVLLYNNENVVHKRRLEDKSKKRETTLDKVILDLATEEAFAEFYAKLRDRKLKKIETNNEACVSLKDFIKEVFEND